MHLLNSISKIKRASNERSGTTPSFICEVPLNTTSIVEKAIDSTYEASRQLYNACLGEGKRRLGLLRESKAYQKARSLDKKDPMRQRLFKEAKEQYEFTEYSLHAYAAVIKNSWIGEHLGINLAQKLATRAFQAVEKLLYRKAKRVRFKSKGQLDSIEEKTNKTGIRWKGTDVKFQGHFIPALIDKHDPVVAHALTKRVKYCRLIRRCVKGKCKYYVQLVCEGTPLSLQDRKDLKSKDGKTELPKSNAVIGLDLGPSTVAIVGEGSASLHQFCEELDDRQSEMRRLQRKLDRQRRANNPENYRRNGTIKPGPKKWTYSLRQKETQNQIAEVSRANAAHRKSLHGQLINKNIALDSEIRLEKLSYRSFQKNFGKSVGNRAPGMFIERLKRKAANACGSVIEFSPFKTRLSQMCICGKSEKKPLSQRMHRCSCGVEAQRDLFSAYLARFVQEDRLDVPAAKRSWETGAEVLLRTAYEWKCQTANRGACPSSFGISKEMTEKSGSSAQERTTCERRQPNNENWNVVRPDLAFGMRVQ